jgi:hypothetical protein
MTWDSFSQPTVAAWAPLRLGQAYGGKLMEFGAINVKSAVEFAAELSRVKTPMDFAEAISNETRRRFEAATEQFEELSLLFGAGKSSDDAPEDAGLGD